MYFVGEFDLNKNEKDWLKFLNPSNIYYNFMVSSLFITAYDLLKNSIISQIESFYTFGFNENGFILDEKYKKDVLELDYKKDKLRGSILWLMNNNIITNDDKNMFEEIREHRNLLAHETLKILTDSEKEINIDLLVNIKKLLQKIDQWFILEVELPTDPDMTKEKYDSIDRENVKSMSMIYLDYLMHIIFDSSAEYGKVYKEFKETITKKYNDKNSE